MFGLRYLRNVTTLELHTEKCTGCRMCTSVCPHHVFAMANLRAAIVDVDACMECGACALNCPEGAISVQAGVGCAAAVINSKLGKSPGEGDCCCAGEESACC